MNKSNVPCHITEYNVKFKTHDADSYHPRGMIKPPQKIIARDTKMQGDTTTGLDYIAHPVTPLFKRPPVSYCPPEEGMLNATEYKESFRGKWQAPTQPILPSRKVPDRDECVDHTTTNMVDFSAPPITPRQVHKGPNTYEPPKTPFSDRSTTHTEYVDYGKVPMTPSIKPPSKVTRATQPLDGKTSYKSTFTTPAMPGRFQRPKQVYMPSGEKFSSSTTFRAAYPGYLNQKPREPIKPPCHKHTDPRIPVETTTTNRRAYKAWEIPERYSRPPTTFVQPTEKISGRTTSNTHYIDFGRVPSRASCKPAHKREETGPFEGRTTKNEDYKFWSGVRRPDPFTQHREYEPPKEKIDGVTTFKSHFKGEFEPRAPSTKPTTSIPTKSSGMDGTTMYKEHYSGPGYRPCPSVPIVENKAADFVFSHENASGHKFYKPVASH